MNLVAASNGSAGAGLIIVVLLYFVPSIVAASRKVSNAGSVFVINLLLGWTMIGWVVALAMAVKTKIPRVSIVTSGVKSECAQCGAQTRAAQFCSSCGAPKIPA